MKLTVLLIALALQIPKAYTCSYQSPPGETFVLERSPEGEEPGLDLGDNCELSPQGYDERGEVWLTCGANTYAFVKEN